MANAKYITKTIIGEDLYYLKDKEVRDSLGQANGIATLDEEGKISSSQIPSASENTLGGIKVGNNLHINNNGVLSADLPDTITNIEIDTLLAY